MMDELRPMTDTWELDQRGREINALQRIVDAQNRLLAAHRMGDQRQGSRAATYLANAERAWRAVCAIRAAHEVEVDA